MSRDKLGRFIKGEYSGPNLKGRKLSLETIAKMKGRIPWNKGKVCPQLAGANNGFYGKKHNEEVLEQNRLAHIGKKANENQLRALASWRGENRIGKPAPWAKKLPQNFKSGVLHPMWSGGSKSWRGSEWKRIKKLVEARDGKVCVYCNKTTNISIHHIIPYRVTQDNSIENLITLCKSCHAVEDWNYVNRPEGQQDWIKIFIKGKLTYFYGNFNKPDEFKAKIRKAIEVRNEMNQLIGGIV